MESEKILYVSPESQPHFPPGGDEALVAGDAERQFATAGRASSQPHLMPERQTFAKYSKGENTQPSHCKE